jgi:hypothetical protein
MPDRPRPEDFMAMGLFIYEFGKIERLVDRALAEGLSLVQKPPHTDSLPNKFQKRVQMLITLHRRWPPLNAYQVKIEPALKEIKQLLLMRNDIAHGRFDEYQHDILAGAERAATLRRELIAAMEWRASSSSPGTAKGLEFG